MSFSKPTVLIVFALEIEERGLFGDLTRIYSGVGKVNAAHHLTRALAQWNNKHGKLPELVLNLGSAGSPHFKAGSLVNCTRFIQRDMDTTALGTAPYATPYDETPAMLTNGLRFGEWPEGICGSGDNFVTDGKTQSWNVVDMEAYALAKVCAFEQIPFGCLKFITDGADGHAAGSWEQALTAAAETMREAVGSVLNADLPDEPARHPSINAQKT